MEIVAIAIGITGFAIAGVIYSRLSNEMKSISAAKTELESRLGQLESRRKKAELRIEEMVSRTKRLEADLADAIARRDEKAVAAALWNLELERSQRQWRDVVVPSTRRETIGGDRAAMDESSSGARLAFAIQQEVDRLREEVGVSIRFEGALDVELGPESALTALRISEELLAAASKNADVVSVIVDEGEEASVAIEFICDGWGDAAEFEHSEIGNSLKAAARRLDGWVRYESRDENVLRVSVRLPAESSWSAAAKV